MWELGHLGIGAKIAAPFSRKLSYGWLLFGTILPDLIDKPLYYGLSLFTGKRGSDLGFISCTRTVGHTGILLLTMAAVASVKKSKRLTAVTLGMATHLFLDGFQDLWSHVVSGLSGESSLAMAAFFPFYGGELSAHFGTMPFANLGEHLKAVGHPFLFLTEAIGALCLAFDFWNKKRQRFSV